MRRFGGELGRQAVTTGARQPRIAGRRTRPVGAVDCDARAVREALVIDAHVGGINAQRQCLCGCARRGPALLGRGLRCCGAPRARIGTAQWAAAAAAAALWIPSPEPRPAGGAAPQSRAPRPPPVHPGRAPYSSRPPCGVTAPSRPASSDRRYASQLCSGRANMGPRQRLRGAGHARARRAATAAGQARRMRPRPPWYMSKAQATTRFWERFWERSSAEIRAHSIVDPDVVRKLCSRQPVQKGYAPESTAWQAVAAPRGCATAPQSALRRP